MFVGNDYYIAWICYLVSVLTLAFVWYKLTPWLPKHFRAFTSIFLVSLFVAPAKVIEGEIWSAPALILVPFEMLSNSSDTGIDHLLEPLINIQLLTVLLFLGYFLIQRLVTRVATSQDESNKSVATDSDAKQSPDA